MNGIGSVKFYSGYTNYPLALGGPAAPAPAPAAAAPAPAPAVPAPAPAAPAQVLPLEMFTVKSVQPIAPNSEENLQAIYLLKFRTRFLIMKYAVYTSIFGYLTGPTNKKGLNQDEGEVLDALEKMSKKLSLEYFNKTNPNMIMGKGDIKNVQIPRLQSMMGMASSHLPDLNDMAQKLHDEGEGIYQSLKKLASDPNLSATIRNDLQPMLGGNLDEFNEIEMMKKVKEYYRTADGVQKEILGSIATVLVEAAIMKYAGYTSIFGYLTGPTNKKGLNQDEGEVLDALEKMSKKLSLEYFNKTNPNMIMGKGDIKNVQIPRLQGVMGMIGGQLPILNDMAQKLQDEDKQNYQSIRTLYDRLPAAQKQAIRALYDGLPADQKEPSLSYLGSDIDSFDEIGFLRALNGINVVVNANPPVFSSVTPSSGNQGATITGVAIVGTSTNFSQVSTTLDFGSGITVSNISVSSPTQLTCDIAIDGSAAIGARNVVVTTGSEIVTGTNAFTVSAPPAQPKAIPFEVEYGGTGGAINGRANFGLKLDFALLDPHLKWLEPWFDADFYSCGTGPGVRLDLSDRVGIKARYGVMITDKNVMEIDRDNSRSVQTASVAFRADLMPDRLWTTGKFTQLWQYHNGQVENSVSGLKLGLGCNLHGFSVFPGFYLEGGGRALLHNRLAYYSSIEQLKDAGYVEFGVNGLGPNKEIKAGIGAVIGRNVWGVSLKIEGKLSTKATVVMPGATATGTSVAQTVTTEPTVAANLVIGSKPLTVRQAKKAGLFPKLNKERGKGLTNEGMNNDEFQKAVREHQISMALHLVGLPPESGQGQIVNSNKDNSVKWIRSLKGIAEQDINSISQAIEKQKTTSEAQEIELKLPEYINVKAFLLDEYSVARWDEMMDIIKNGGKIQVSKYAGELETYAEWARFEFVSAGGDRIPAFRPAHIQKLLNNAWTVKIGTTEAAGLMNESVVIYDEGQVRENDNTFNDLLGKNVINYDAATNTGTIVPKGTTK